jgi:hypothetical protein
LAVVGDSDDGGIGELFARAQVDGLQQRAAVGDSDDSGIGELFARAQVDGLQPRAVFSENEGFEFLARIQSDGLELGAFRQTYLGELSTIG